MVAPAVIAAGATAGSGLLQGILQLEAEKRRQRLEQERFDVTREDRRFSQELQGRRDQIAQPGKEATRESQTLQNLLANLRATI